MKEFINAFELNKDGKLSKCEFLEYYTDLSVGIPSDDEFLQIILNSWGVREEGEFLVSKEELKMIV